jgi:tetratricopeptide (TPR) repeat protein
MADRYTYLPTLGLWLLVGIGFAKAWEWTKAKTALRFALGAFLIIVIAFYGLKTRAQMKIWKNSETLWTYELNNADYIPDLAYYGLGRILEDKNNLPEAIKYFETAYTLNRQNTQFKSKLASALAKNGEERRALELCSEMTAAEPNNPLVHFAAARVLFVMGKFEGSIPELNKALELDPKYKPAMALLVGAHFKMGDKAASRRLLEKFKNEGVILTPELESELLTE